MQIMDSFNSCCLLSFFVLTISLFYYILRQKYANTDKLPPGPPPLPLIGSLLELGHLPHRSLARLAKVYGPVMSLRLGQTTLVVISSPSATKEVLQKHDQFLSARTVPDAGHALNYHRASIIWSQPSQQWKHLRTILKTHLSTTQSLCANQSLRQEKVHELVEHLQRRTGQVTDIGRAVLRTAINQLSAVIFSVDLVDLNADSAQEFEDLISEVVEEVGAPNIADFFPWLRAIDPQGRKRRAATHLKKMFRIFDEVMDVRLKDGLSGTSNDFLDALLELREKEPDVINRRAIKSILGDIFVAGSDTSSKAVEWAMAELLRHPSLMATAREELKSVVGQRKQVEESDLPRLPFLQAVVKETLRLHPPAPLLVPHKAERAVEVSGFIVPEGSTVMVNVWGIGRDEEVWEKPELFEPERFLRCEVEYKGADFELIPFGSGRRICPGLPLAHLNVHMMLGSLIHSFEWRLPDGMNPGDVDLTEKFITIMGLATPLHAVPLPITQ